MLGKKIMNDNGSYTRDNNVASKDATPATIIVAWASFWPVPPERLPSAVMIDGEQQL
jgi:hypothetical protein